MSKARVLPINGRREAGKKKMKPQAAPENIRREVEELQLLFKISQILDMSLDLRDVVQPILEAMAEHMDMLRGTITLLNRETR